MHWLNQAGNGALQNKIKDGNRALEINYEVYIHDLKINGPLLLHLKNIITTVPCKNNYCITFTTQILDGCMHNKIKIQRYRRKINIGLHTWTLK